MNEIDQLVNTLKRRLKIQGMTYRDLAVALGVSEPSVKRMFALRRFSVDRVVAISHLLGFTLAELSNEAAVSESRLHTLTEEQEGKLVSDTKLLLVAVCVLNQWEIRDIVETYALTEAGAGSDLGSLKTEAKRDGAGWVLDSAAWMSVVEDGSE